jgi:hypothetical protein
VELGEGCINNAVDEVDREYGGDIEWPEPDLCKEWKEAMATASERVLCGWYCEEVRAKVVGRKAAYCRIREAELRAEEAMQPRGQARTSYQLACHLVTARPCTPAPPTKLSLKPLEVSVITRMRCHMPACIRTHCGHQAHVLRHIRHASPPPIAHWHLRTCALRCLFHADARA